MTPSDILRLRADYQAAGLLSSSFEQGVMPALADARPRTAPEIARELDLPPLYAEQLLDCLVALDVLEVDAQRYRLRDAWREAVEREGAALASAFADLGEGVRRWFGLGRGEPGDRQSQEDVMFQTGEGLEGYLLGVRQFNDAMSDRLADVLVCHLRELPAPRIADVGGGHAAFTLKLLSRHPGALGTVLDLPATLEVSRRLNGAHPHADRLRYLAADARTLVPGEQLHDLVMVNDLLHSFGRADKEAIVSNALAIAAPDGLVAVTKFTHEKAAAHRVNALFSMKLYANTNGTGYLESDEALLEMLQQRGASLLESFHCENKSGFVFKVPSADASSGKAM